MASADFCHVLRIEPHPANVREDLGDLTELADSIREQGILQPIVVQPNPRKHGHYLILAGQDERIVQQVTAAPELVGVNGNSANRGGGDLPCSRLLAA